jgi:hypothetical protein
MVVNSRFSQNRDDKPPKVEGIEPVKGLPLSQSSCGAKRTKDALERALGLRGKINCTSGSSTYLVKRPSSPSPKVFDQSECSPVQKMFLAC